MSLGLPNLVELYPKMIVPNNKGSNHMSFKFLVRRIILKTKIKKIKKKVIVAFLPAQLISVSKRKTNPIMLK